MIRIIIVIAALIAGLFFGPEISSNKGYILISLDTYTTYETTIINALIVTVVFYFVLGLIEWVLRKLLSMSSITRGWFGQRKTKKAERNSLLGMLALLEGNSRQAQKLLSKSAERTAAPALTYIAAAKAAGADAFITSDLKYHDFFAAEDRILLTDVGHYESEQYTKELLVAHLSKKITNFAAALSAGRVLLSQVNTNPITYY